MKTLGDFKPGDTFGFCAIVTDESGEPVTLDAENIKSQVRDYKDNLKAELVVVKHPEDVGSYLFSAPPEVTELWPLGPLFIDIETNSSGIISSSETFKVNIVRQVTKDE
jgi:hypothetical protein